MRWHPGERSQLLAVAAIGFWLVWCGMLFSGRAVQ